MAITPSVFDSNNKGASVTLSGGNLVATVSAGTGSVAGTNTISGPTYFEMVVGATLTGSCRIGLANPLFTMTGLLGVDNNGIAYDSGGTVKLNNVTVATLAAFVAGNNIGVAVDPQNKLIWFRVGTGNWNNDVIANQNPVGAVGGISYATVNIPSKPAFGASATASVTANFSTASWANSAPSGFITVDTLASAQLNGDVANRSASFTQYGKVAGVAPPSPTFTSELPVNKSASFNRAWYGSNGVYAPAAAPKYISGQTQELGSPVAGKKVYLYDATTGIQIGSAISDGSGNFSIPSMGRTNVFAVGLDPSYQAIVYDQLTPV